MFESGLLSPHFLGYFEKHPYEVINTESKVFNKEHKYAGRSDIKGIYDVKTSVMDVKTTSAVDKESCFKQLAAYAKADGNEDVEQMVIIPLNSKTVQGFSKPVVSTEIDKYFAAFQKDRKLFKDRFGL